jgi:hypothetical protein
MDKSKRHKNQDSDKILKNIEGDINNDTPLKIVSASIVNGSIHCQVEWEERRDGTKPCNSVVESGEIRSKHPYKLLEFYESKVYKKQSLFYN